MQNKVWSPLSPTKVVLEMCFSCELLFNSSLLIKGITKIIQITVKFLNLNCCVSMTENYLMLSCIPLLHKILSLLLNPPTKYSTPVRAFIEV